MLNDLFNTNVVDLHNITCHSGGAKGADSYWESIGEKWGVKTNAYSYKTSYHSSKNKVEITDTDYQEGVLEINKANKVLNRYGINKYMNLLARNWAQVKYSRQIFAIGYIVDVGKKSPKGYYSKAKIQTVDGGTGYAVQMAINNLRDVYVFDQLKLKWHRWSYTTSSFFELEKIPTITCQDFAGIGTREITADGIKAIEDVYTQTFNIPNKTF
jgi:hypothetical protein